MHEAIELHKSPELPKKGSCHATSERTPKYVEADSY
jgi:hypothetical protein